MIIDREYRGTYAEVNLGALERNFRALQRIVGDTTFLCPMVKANAYGHGEIQVTRRLEQIGCRQVGVGLIEEGVYLRNNGINLPTILFGPFDREGVRGIQQNHLIPVLSAPDQLQILESSELSGIEVHLKFNTGMNRLGFAVEDAAELLRRIEASGRFRVVGICSHLMEGEDAGQPEGLSTEQWRRYQPLLQIFPAPKYTHHLYNSAALLNIWNRKRRGEELGGLIPFPFGARPGLAIYGLKPALKVDPELVLEPVLKLCSRIVAIHHLKAGERVSYGGTWSAPQEALVGVVPIGYADGYRRELGSKAWVGIGGRKAPIVGRVCMDYTMVDLSSHTDRAPESWLGETVDLYGGTGPSVPEVARWQGTIPWEVLTTLGERVPRRYVD